MGADYIRFGSAGRVLSVAAGVYERFALALRRPIAR